MIDPMNENEWLAFLAQSSDEDIFPAKLISTLGETLMELPNYVSLRFSGSSQSRAPVIEALEYIAYGERQPQSVPEVISGDDSVEKWQPALDAAWLWHLKHLEPEAAQKMFDELTSPESGRYVGWHPRPNFAHLMIIGKKAKLRPSVFIYSGGISETSADMKIETAIKMCVANISMAHIEDDKVLTQEATILPEGWMPLFRLACDWWKHFGPILPDPQ